MSTIFPSSFRIRLLNLMGFKINTKAKLKLFSIVLVNDINIGAFAKIDSFVLIAGLDKLIMEEYSAIQRFTYISGKHQVKIGKRAMIGSRSAISTSAGNIEIGEYSALAPRSTIHTHGTFLPVTLGYPNKNCGVKIGNFCWIMHSSSISPGVTIESNSIILPGSMVTKDVPGNSVVFDTPVQRKTFPLYFFKKKVDDLELINMIKEITINYLTQLKSKNAKVEFSIEDEVILVQRNKSKYYKIFFSDFNSEVMTNAKDVTLIYFYYDLSLEIMQKKQFVFYDFRRIIKSYAKIPEILSEFDDFVFFNYGLRFTDISYY